MKKIKPVSFSEASNFLGANPEKKMKIVHNIKHKSEYEPQKDYYKPIRESIKSFINRKDEKVFLSLIDNMKDLMKKEHFLILQKGYLSFVKRHKGELFIPVPIMMKINEIDLKLKADLGIMTNGKVLLVKLYYNKEPLSKQDNTLGLYLLKREYESQYGKDVVCGILDIRRNNLYENLNYSSLEIILNSELELFAKMLKAA